MESFAASSWPRAFRGKRLGDVSFARAYDRLADVRRAELKTVLAGLFALYGGRRQWPLLVERGCGALGRGLIRQAPLAWTLVVFDAAFCSPVRLLAACLPALCAGVGQMAVARLGGEGEWDDGLLVALELAGLETAFDLAPEDLPLLAGRLDKDLGPGIVADVGLAPVALDAFPDVSMLRPGYRGRIEVWRENCPAIDYAALARNHPDAAVTAWGRADGRLPKGVRRRAGTFEDFLRNRPDVALVPRELARRALERAELVLVPGLEGFWAWPGLSPERFCRHGATFFPEPDPLSPERP